MVPAGYSARSLTQKLGLKEGHTVALVAAPTTWELPEDEPCLTVRRDLRGKPDVVIAFVRSRAELVALAPRLVRVLTAPASLWLAWPRKAGGHVSDVTEQSLRDQFLPTGLVDTKVAALDDDWSGLRFVWRRERRAEIARQPAKR